MVFIYFVISWVTFVILHSFLSKKQNNLGQLEHFNYKKMKEKIIKLITFTLLIGIVFFVVKQRLLVQSDFVNGRRAPDFSAKLISGKDVQLSDFKGNYILLDFWASWCGPCRRTNPKIVKLFENFKNVTFKNAKKFIIISIALEKKGEIPWKAAIEQDHLYWPYHILDMENKIAALYGVTKIPSSFLVSPEGLIIGVNQDTRAITKLLEPFIEGHLAH